MLRKISGILLSLAICSVIVGGGTSHALASTSTKPQADVGVQGTCSYNYVWPRRVSFWLFSQPDGYIVKGRATMGHDAAAGCILFVCVDHEQSDGRWVPLDCARNILQAGEPNYTSWAAIIDCSNPYETGRYRSYIRFEGQSTAQRSPADQVCP
jgi:hypothetical protein